jgi:hypothetical protein
VLSPAAIQAGSARITATDRDEQGQLVLINSG